VFVQLVIAAITTAPCSSAVVTAGSATAVDAPLAVADTCDDPPASAPFFDDDAIIELRPAWKPLFACFSDTRSCGRFGIRIAGHAEEALRLRIRFNQRDLFGLAPRQLQVVERHLVDRENRDCRAVLGAHVAQRGAVGDRQMLEPRAEELHELADDAVLAQLLGDGQHQVGRRRAFQHRAGQAEAQHLRDEHRDWLAEHRGLRFDAADAPSHHAQTVHHRRVRVGADQRVGETDLTVGRIGRHDDAREILEVHLVDDAGVRRDDAEVGEGVLPPAEKRVALLVARELQLGVQLESVGLAEVVDLHRVIDHQLDRLQRVDLVRIAAEPRDAVAHGREVHNRRNAREVLQQHACRRERNLALHRALDVPPGQRFDVGGLHEAAVLVAEEVLEQDFQGKRQPGDLGEPRALERWEAEHLVGTAAHREGGAGAEAVHGGHAGRSFGENPIVPHAFGGRATAAVALLTGCSPSSTV
jgi:hypothetical protein